MNKILKDFIKSLLFGILIFFGLGFPMGVVFNGDDAGIAILEFLLQQQ